MNSSWVKSLLVDFDAVSSANPIRLWIVGHPSRPAPTVVVTPGTVTVLRGQTQQFVAQVSGSSDKTVTWTVAQGIGGGTINSAGLYTAPLESDDPAATVTVTVTATTKGSPGAFGSASVELPSVTLSIAPGAISVGPGLSQAFTVTASGIANNDVNWTVQGSDGGTITSAGLYTAPSAPGIYKVSATASADAYYSATSVVLVTANSSPFSPAGNLVHERRFHTATLMADGKVLVAGGLNTNNCPDASDLAELYDPASRSFAPSSSMTSPRYNQTATLLQNGKVLITGGNSFNFECSDQNGSGKVTSAELYDPSSGSFTPTGSMNEARGGHTATLLPSGKVLIVGGNDVGGLATAEVYDPATGTFTPTANMPEAPIGQTATLLLDGKVLIAGGISGSSGSSLATTELYDPLTGAFTVSGTMTTPRAGHTATLLPDGKVLVTGGFPDSTGVGTDTAEIYDPAKASFLATNKAMVVARWGHTATLLPDGTLLLFGGQSLDSLVAETYSPSDGSFSAVGVVDSNGTGHSATLLKNGSVLIIEGTTADLYQ